MKLKASYAELFGADPKKPDKSEISPEAAELHLAKKNDKSRIRKIHDEMETLKKHARVENVRPFRWMVLIFVNILFVVSYSLDIQLLEGALTASRFAGFHMADLNSALQVTLAYKHIVINLLIGTVTVFIFWWLLGGRTFCAWVCPYHLLSEITEIIHLKLAKKGWVKDHPLDRRARSWFWLVFAILALVTGYTVYETISPTGILSRALIYGPGVALAWVSALLLFEIFWSRRAWCRYACPIGLTYGLVGAISPFRINYNLDKCFHDGECKKVCLVPHVLEPIIKGRAKKLDVGLGADCTRCGRCIDVCPTQSLTFKFKGIGEYL